MVTGYNVDVRYDGKVYHVQTEDKGRKNPVIETLIYLGGNIIHQDKNSYEDENDDANYDEDKIRARLNAQHEKHLALINAGTHDPDRKPFGEEYITARSLDECISDYLDEEGAARVLTLDLVSETPYVPGQRGAVTVRVMNQTSGEPIAGAILRPRLIQESGPSPLPEGTTDDKGEATIEFNVPNEARINAAIVVFAESDDESDELHRLIR